MCGRFTLRTKLNLLLQQFAIEEADLTLLPRYNIAPTTFSSDRSEKWRKRELQWLSGV